MIPTTLLLLFYVAIAIIEARYFYYRKNVDRIYRLNLEHTYLVLARIPVWAMYFMMTSWQMTVAAILCFPLIHDGAYYMYRHYREGIYPKGFMAHSKEDTSVLRFLTFPVRCVLAGIGIVIALWL